MNRRTYAFFAVAFSIGVLCLAPIDNPPGGTGATGPAGPSGSPGLQGSPGPIATPTPGAIVSDTAYDATSWDGVTTIAPSKNAVRDKIEAVVASIPTDFESGVYTPTLTDITNVAGSIAYQCQYLRVGTTVTVSGQIRIDPTLTGQTQVDLSLPVVSSAVNPENLAGTAVSTDAASVQAAAIYNNGAGLARIDYLALTLTNDFWYFSFTYKTTID